MVAGMVGVGVDVDVVLEALLLVWDEVRDVWAKPEAALEGLGEPCIEASAMLTRQEDTTKGLWAKESQQSLLTLIR